MVNERPQLQPMKTFLTVLGVIAAVVLVWIAVDSTKPKLFAKVQHSKTEVVVTNGNDVPWGETTIRLNDAFDLIEHVERGPWRAGESRTIPLSDFYSKMRKQAFNPEFERLDAVSVEVSGFQSGIYRVRARD